MLKKFIASMESHLPLTILDVEWNDPVLSLMGANWSFNTTSTWRLVDESRLIAGSEDELAQNAIKMLVGIDIVRCEPMSISPALDPRFILKNGFRLEIFSATATEPWVMSLKDGPIFVASPSA